MPVIFVPKAFRLLVQGGLREFAAGTHDVEDGIAGHWWVMMHSRPQAIAAVDAFARQADAGKPPAGSDADQEPETEEEKAKDAALAEKGETKEALLEQAKQLGVTVDGRWGLAKLQAAIDAALAS